MEVQEGKKFVELFAEYLQEHRQRQEQQRLYSVQCEYSKAASADTAGTAIEKAAAAVKRLERQKRQRLLKVIRPASVEPQKYISIKDVDRQHRQQNIRIAARLERRQGKIKTYIRKRRFRIAARASAAAVHEWQQKQEELCRAFNLAVFTEMEKARFNEYPLARKAADVERLEQLRQELQELSTERAAK